MISRDAELFCDDGEYYWRTSELIGTPKAREIFEADLRSARKGQGLELYSGILYNKRNVESQSRVDRFYG